LLELINLCHTFTKQGQPIDVFDSVHLTMAAKEFAAVSGPSGCGKSTLLLIAGSMLRPRKGQVIIDGVDVYTLRADQRAELRNRSVGFIFQRFCLVPYLSVMQNVLAPAIGRGVTPELEKRALELLESVGLSKRLEHRPSELSAGQQQRTATARALLFEPKLILADEPTGNLDPESASRVLEALRAASRRGAAVLMATHSPDSAQRAGVTRHLPWNELNLKNE